MGQESFSTLIITYWVPEDAAAQTTGDDIGDHRDSADQQQRQSAATDAVAGSGKGSGKSSDGQVGQDAGMGADAMRAGRQDSAGNGMQQQSASMGGGASRSFDPNRDMIYLPPEKVRLFDKLDQNDDGVIARGEADAHEPLSQRFDEINDFANQGITRSEFAAFEIEDEVGADRDAQAPDQDQQDKLKRQ